ncbi:MAG: glycosyltransferase [Gemmatimonadetes bacterium]|nr:glycosyltransferase [Gemmatimonadota bacterium]
MSTPLVSVIVPLYNERENLSPLFQEIRQAMGILAYEVLAVDDRSTDGSLEELHRLASDYPQMRILSLARRSGQSAAVAAGFEAARGEVIATLDADGQNDPADVPRLLAVLDGPGGPDAVVGFRVARTDSWWKQLQSRFANLIRDGITGDRVRDSACSLRVIRRSVLPGIPRFDGMHRFLPTLIRMRGGTVVQVPTRDRPRRSGRSKYGMLDRAWRGLFDAFGVRWLRRRALTYEVRSEK